MALPSMWRLYLATPALWARKRHVRARRPIAGDHVKRLGRPDRPRQRVQEVEQLRVDGVDVAGAEVPKELVHLDQAVGVVALGAPRRSGRASRPCACGQTQAVDRRRRALANTSLDKRHADGRAGKHAHRAPSRQARRVRRFQGRSSCCVWRSDAASGATFQYTDCLVIAHCSCDSGAVRLSFTGQELHACT